MSCHLKRIPALLFALAVLLTPRLVQAQEVFGSIFGTVTDASGGAVANATITVTDISKGTSSTVTTDASGNYNKGQLIPDTYRVVVEATGFGKVTSNEIVVQVNQASRFDAPLQVGNVATQVEVTAAAPLLQADRADVAQTFTGKELNELPNIGRNAQEFELLNPGTARLGWQHASDEDPQGSVQMVVNGQLFDSMGYELDGTTNQDPILGIIVINPTLDSLAEVKQANQDYDAEYEYVGGGVAAYSTKSGSNSFHGDAFEYLQLNTPGFTTFARNPFTDLPPATFRYNQFGGSIGGPIIKNKLFFFGDAQLNRVTQGASVLTSVPDALNRTGNFSDWLTYNSNNQIYNPNTGVNGVGRTPYPNNVIPASQLSPQALAIMNYFPLPNYQQISNEPFINNYEANGAIAVTGNLWNTREDYYLNEKNTIFGRYSDQAFTESGPGVFGLVAGGPAFGAYAGNSVAGNKSLALGWTSTISATLVNEFRFGYEHYHVFDVPNGYGTDPASAAGIPGLNLDKTYTSGLPSFDIGGGTFKLGYSLDVNQCNCPLTQTESQYQFVDNLTKISGNHSFKFGTDLRYAQNLRVPSDSHRAGDLYFSGNATGDVGTGGGSASPGVGLATYLLGDVTSFDRYVSSSTTASEHQPRFFFYGQDEWRPTPKLTITYGLRWEMIFPESVNAAGNGATFNLNNDQIYVFGEGGTSLHGIQTMNWHEFAPRLSIAYQITPKTVIRAGYGWSYDLGVFGSNFGHNVTQNPPVLSQQNLTPAGGNYASVFNLAQGPPSLTPVTVSANGTFALPLDISPKFRPATVTLPTVYQYNLSLQRQLTNRIALTGAYVGNQNRHGFNGTSNTININEPEFIPADSSAQYLARPFYQKFGLTQDLGGYYCDCANEMYNSFQGQIKVNALQGWTLQGSYTYQRQYGGGWGYDSNYYFLYDRSAGEGYSNLIPNQQWTLAQSYEIPFGRGRRYAGNMNRIADLALGGWNASGIMTYYSGFGYSPTLENYGSQGGQPYVNGSRPDVGTGNPYAGAQGNRNQWFVGGCTSTGCASNSAFAIPAANTFGDYPINTLYGPQFINLDFSLMKTFHLTERIGFTLRTDARNVLNHTNLGSPNTDIQSANAGQITGLAAGTGGYMRTLQFSGTIAF
jgi:hypothetical protein